MKLHHRKFRLDTRKRFFPEKVVGYRLYREVVTATSLSEFKKHLENALSPKG